MCVSAAFWPPSETDTVALLDKGISAIDHCIYEIAHTKNQPSLIDAALLIFFSSLLVVFFLIIQKQV